MTFAVIFDFDGVIVDSETAEFEAHRRIFSDHGLELGREEWCTCVGLWKAVDWFGVLGERASTQLSEAAFVTEKRRIFREVVKMEPLPGIRSLLEDLAAAGVPLAIASTSPARWVVTAVEEIGIDRYFPVIVTGDEVTNRKPAPDVYLAAADRLGMPPTRCVAIEDTQPGLAAAQAAGMRVVVIPHWLTETHNLERADLRVAGAGELSAERLRSLAGKG